jgi:polar amino acid transport system substrate-binding protein
MPNSRRNTLVALLACAGLSNSRFGFAQSENTLAQIKQRGSLRVGVTQAPPWYSKDPKTGEWSSGLGV